MFLKSDIEKSTKPSNVSLNRRISWIDVTVLLRVAMLYVASRLFITLATIYLPLYIEETKVDGKQALASVPLVSYVFSFTAALLLKYLNRICSTKVNFYNKKKKKRQRDAKCIFVSLNRRLVTFSAL